MRTSQDQTNAGLLQNELPAHPRTASDDRRPTLLSAKATGTHLFNGWGPRLGM
jgi:hypothetical protein